MIWKRSDLDSAKKIRVLKLGGGGCDLRKFQFSGGGGDLESQNPKCQDLPKLQLSGRGGVWKVKTQSALICLNFNLGGGEIQL